MNTHTTKTKNTVSMCIHLLVKLVKFVLNIVKNILSLFEIVKETCPECGNELLTGKWTEKTCMVGAITHETVWCDNCGYRRKRSWVSDASIQPNWDVRVLKKEIRKELRSTKQK